MKQLKERVRDHIEFKKVHVSSAVSEFSLQSPLYSDSCSKYTRALSLRTHTLSHTYRTWKTISAACPYR
jgi:hypothetical protein